MQVIPATARAKNACRERIVLVGKKYRQDRNPSRRHANKKVSACLPKKNPLPLVIQRALERLDALLLNSHIRWGRRQAVRAMRPERRRALKKILTAMLKASTLQFDGALCRVTKDKKRARPLTIAELASFAGLSLRGAWRAIADLKDLGLLKTVKQQRFEVAAGLAVAPCLRFFTRLFWDMLNLWSLFIESVKYARADNKLNFQIPIKIIARTRIQERNSCFIQAVECKQRFRGRCYGGRLAPEVCSICRQFVQFLKD